MYDHDRVTDPYLNWRSPLPEPPLEPTTTALRIIDMQYADASMDAGSFVEKRERSRTADLNYVAGRREQIVPVILRCPVDLVQEDVTGPPDWST